MSTNSRFAGIIAVVAIIALLAGTWFIGVAPRLDEARVAEGDRDAAVAQNTIHAARLESLRQLDSELPALLEELSGLTVVVPGDTAFPDYLRQVEAIGVATGVAITVIGFDGPTLYAGPEDDESGDTELAAARQSVNPGNFLTLGVTIQLAGPHGGVLAAIDALQSTGRFTLVHDITLPMGFVGEGDGVEATVSGQLFILRDGGVPAVTAEEPGESEDAAAQ